MSRYNIHYFEAEMVLFDIDFFVVKQLQAVSSLRLDKRLNTTFKDVSTFRVGQY